MSSLSIDWLIGNEKTKWVYELIYFFGKFNLNHYRVVDLSLSLVILSEWLWEFALIHF